MILGSITSTAVIQAVEMATKMEVLGSNVEDYEELNMSVKVIKIIQSYTGVVDKMVWRKF
jgi:UDP-N-acetylglucosamine 2-epimerase (non-hydrolysing)